MLTVNQQEINLGRLKLSVPHVFKYILKNEGINVLKIKKITLGCDKCTTASTQKSTLAPKETCDLDVVFTPGAKGLALKTIEIQSEVNKLELKFRAKVDG